MEDLNVIILAAGEGTRMKSKKPKVLHEILNKTMLDYVIDEANRELSSQRLSLVRATQITLKNALNLIGVSAPEKM